jgi:hypothetical protein
MDTPKSPASLAKEAGLLRDGVELLRSEVEKLRAAVVQLRPRVEAAERTSVRAVNLLIIAIVALAVTLGAWSQAQTNRRIDGMCPVLALVLGTSNPESRPEGPARDQYIRSIGVIRHAYDELRCTDPLVPPAAN